MKKPVKVVLWTVGGLVAFFVLLVVALPLWIGPVVTSVANAIVPGYTGTDFKLEGFSLNPYSGKLRVTGVKLSNPKGYDEPMAVSVDSIAVDLDPASLFSKKIHIYDITIESPFVSYVFDAAGSNNFERIAANAAAKSGPKDEKAEEKPEAKDEKKDGKKVQIDRLAINGTVVKYRMIKLPIPIPIPTLKDIGKDDEGASAEQVEETVWNSIKDKFTSVGGALSSAAGSLGEGATNLLKGASESLTGAGDAASKTADSVKDGAKAVSEGAKNFLKGAGGLLGGQKK